MSIALLLSVLAQATTHRMPPAGPLLPPSVDEQSIMQPVNALFAGIAERNPAAVQAQLLPGGSATSVVEGADGTRTVERRAWTDVLAHFQPGPEKYEERLTDPAIESDGSVATVWGNYVFLIDGKVHHCGVDHFSLVRQNGSWKVADLSWSQRSTGCIAP